MLLVRRGQGTTAPWPPIMTSFRRVGALGLLSGTPFINREVLPVALSSVSNKQTYHIDTNLTTTLHPRYSIRSSKQTSTTQPQRCLSPDRKSAPTPARRINNRIQVVACRGTADYMPWQHADVEYSDIIKIILAIFLPPLGVFLERGCGADLLINIVRLPQPYDHLLSRTILTPCAALDHPWLHPWHYPRAVHHPQVLGACHHQRAAAWARSRGCARKRRSLD